MINSVTNVAPARAGWFDPGQARQREACQEGQDGIAIPGAIHLFGKFRGQNSGDSIPINQPLNLNRYTVPGIPGIPAAPEFPRNSRPGIPAAPEFPIYKLQAFFQRRRYIGTKIMVKPISNNTSVIGR